MNKIHFFLIFFFFHLAVIAVLARWPNLFILVGSPHFSFKEHWEKKNKKRNGYQSLSGKNNASPSSTIFTCSAENCLNKQINKQRNKTTHTHTKLKCVFWPFEQQRGTGDATDAELLW